MRIAAWVSSALLLAFLGWASYLRVHADTDLAISLAAFVTGVVGIPLTLATMVLWVMSFLTRRRSR